MANFQKFIRDIDPLKVPDTNSPLNIQYNVALQKKKMKLVKRAFTVWNLIPCGSHGLVVKSSKIRIYSYTLWGTQINKNETVFWNIYILILLSHYKFSNQSLIRINKWKSFCHKYDFLQTMTTKMAIILWNYKSSPLDVIKKYEAPYKN